jgi:quinol monooxygenase YgiN
MPLIVPGAPGRLGSDRREEQHSPRGDAAGAPPAIRKEGGMYARSMTIHADPQRIDAGIAMMNDDLMQTVLDTDGCVGVSMVCDRDSGRCIVATSWDSEESQEASREQLRPVRDRLADAMGARDYDVQMWEIAAMHRLHPPGDDACARLTWTRGDPATMDRTVDGLRMGLVPRMDELPGFCSMSLMVDRETGMSVLTAVYRDRAAMEQSRPAVTSMRDEFTRETGMEVMDVAEFDLVVHHLRVPEMA